MLYHVYIHVVLIVSLNDSGVECVANALDVEVYAQCRRLFLDPGPWILVSWILDPGILDPWDLGRFCFVHATAWGFHSHGASPNPSPNPYDILHRSK